MQLPPHHSEPFVTAAFASLAAGYCTSIAVTRTTNLRLLLNSTTIYNVFFVQAGQMFVTGTERDREIDSSLTLFVDFADRMSISLCFFVKGLFNS